METPASHYHSSPVRRIHSLISKMLSYIYIFGRSSAHLMCTIQWICAVVYPWPRYRSVQQWVEVGHARNIHHGNWDYPWPSKRERQRMLNMLHCKMQNMDMWDTIKSSDKQCSSTSIHSSYGVPSWCRSVMLVMPGGWNGNYIHSQMIHLQILGIFCYFKGQL